MIADVCVLVVTWNSERTIIRCLQALKASAGGLVCNVVVADNGSADGTVGLIAREFPGVKLLRLEGTAGFAEANNLALQACDPSCKYVLLLNPDAYVGVDCLVNMAACLDGKGAYAGACGPVLLNSDGTVQPSWGRFPSLWSEWSGRIDRRDSVGNVLPRTVPALRALTKPRAVDWVGGACLLVKREALQDLQGPMLDPAFMLYSEEVDLCVRLRRANFRVYLCPQATCVHEGGASTAQVKGRALGLLYTSKVRLFRKHWPRRARLLHGGLTVLAALKAVVWGGARGRAYKEAWAALRAMDKA